MRVGRSISVAGGLRVAMLGPAAALTVFAGAVPAAAAAPAPLVCGQSVTSDIRLNADLSCSGTALLVAADGITLDLNGHRIGGDGSGAGVLVVAHTGVSIRHGTIAGFGEGVSLLPGPVNTAGIALSGLRLRGNTVGVSAMGTRDVRISGSTFTANPTAVRDINGSGTSITHSDVVAGTVVFGNTRGGATLRHSTLVDSAVIAMQADGTLVAGNTLTGSPINVAFSNNVRIEHNVISEAGSGVSLAVTTGGVVTGNRFIRNGVGLAVEVAVDGLSVTANTLAGNDVAGMLFTATFYGTMPTNIANNILHRNGFDPGGRADPRGNPIADGVHVTGPVGAPLVISGNLTVRNAAYGIFAEPGTVIDGGANRSVGDPSGCLGVVCR